MLKKVTLSDVTLLNLAKDAIARTKVPLLNHIFNALVKRHPGRGCSSCAKRARLSQVMIATRTSLAATPASLQALKQLLKADKLVLYIRGPKGKTQKVEV